MNDQGVRAKAASSSDPGDVEALASLAEAAHARGDAGEVEALLQRILTLAPGTPWAETKLIELLIGQDRKQEAEMLAREIVTLRPTDGEAHATIGAMLSTGRLLPAGEWHLRKAIALGGRRFHWLLNLARNLKEQGRLDEALELARDAAADQADNPVPYVLMAEIHEQEGDLISADAALDRVPSLTQVQADDLGISRASIAAQGPEWRKALGTLDAATELPAAMRLTRGRLRERDGRHAEAWRDFVEAKAALAEESGLHYDRAAVEGHYSRVAQVFSAPFWRDLPRVATRSDKPQPLFITGFPRSGTTMIEQVLASHSEIRAGGELFFVSQLCNFAQSLLGRGLPFPAGLGELGVADHHHVPALFRDFYLAQADAQGLTAPGATFFTDKMPLNEAYLPLIRLAFPKAPVIRLRRHPLDVLVSVLSHNMTHGFNCGYRLADAAHQFASVAQLVVHYRDRLDIDFIELGYEHFVGDQENETARLMAYVGLDLEPAQLRFHESRRHAPTPSYAQVRKPVNSGSVERWRPYIEQLRPALPMLRDALIDGGYDFPSI